MTVTEIAFVVMTLALVVMAISLAMLVRQGRLVAMETHELLRNLQPRVEQSLVETTNTLRAIREATDQVEAAAASADRVLSESAEPLMEAVRRLREAQRYVTALTKGAQAAVLAFQRK
jgi:uncharacterized protein YoxC